VQRVQDRGVTFPFFMALLAFPFYMVGGPLGTWMISRKLGWPSDMVLYGFFGGTISATLTAPMSVYAYRFVIEPVLQLTAAVAPELMPARRAGFQLTARTKLILTVIALVGAWTAYAVIVGYSQTRALLENQKQMEQLLSPEARSKLLNQPDHYGAPGVLSSRYFQSRTGGLRVLFLSLLIFAVGTALLLAAAAAREITQPIRLLQDAAERVRQGRYEEPVRLLANDELAELGATLNRMMTTILQHMGAMEAVLANLRGGIRRLEDTVTTVLAVSTEQASGATEQASAVQEVSSIAEQIAATARQIAERTGTVEGIAASTFTASQEGERKLDQAGTGFTHIAAQVEAIRQAMRELQGQFQAVYKIVSMITEIAEQTELLALNASLEAAGAGTAGRRFMVVADATKRLAGRAGEASRQIRGLVERIQKATMESSRLAEGGQEKVAAGGNLIAEAAAAIRNISTLARSTSLAAGEITVSTRQQTTGSEQLAGSIGEIHEVARQAEAGARQIQTAIA
jgi:methyl-accepting chemotaxis protein